MRATIVVRLAQMAAGGGQQPELADALAALLRDDQLPVLRDLGGLGIGDLTELGLGLAEPKAGQAPLTLERGDALALMSSNAATLAVATLACRDLAELLEAGLGVAALTFAAFDGNPEAFAEPVAALRPLPGIVAVSARLRALTAGAGPPAPIQDPFALSCLPQVAGALHEALDRLHDVLAVDVNAAAENPLVVGGQIFHHGGFHAARCGLALDSLRLALVPFAALSSARLAHLMEPELSGLPAFLSADAPGSSGVLVAEYLAGDALARLRADAAPAVLGGVVVSRGLEEHASFAWQSAGLAARAARHLRSVLALEWIAAERALRMKGSAGPAALRAPREGFDARLDDRPIAADAELAEAALPELAAAVIALAAPH